MRARRAAVWVAALIAITAGLIMLFRPSPVNSLPQELHGVWRTGAPKYATRRFEINARILTFQVGEDQGVVTRHAIASVRTSTTPEGTLYRVMYYEDGEDTPELTFDFVLLNEARPAIMLLNQPGVVWRRAAGS